MTLQRNIKLLFVFNFFTDFRFYAPIAILYFTQITGSFALAMSVFSAATISAALFEVPTGIFSDFLGRKGAVILGAVAATFSVFCYALGFSFWILILGAVFEGLARSFYSGNNDALLHDSLSPHERAEKFPHILGKTHSMFQLALAISALLGGFIAQLSFSLVVWLSVLSQFVCLILSLFIIEPKVHYKKSTNIYAHIKEAIMLFIKNPKLRWITIAGVVNFGVGESAWLFRSAFIKLFWPIWAIGIAQTLSNIGSTISFYFSGRLIKKYGELKLLIWGDIYARSINFIALFFPSVLSPALLSTPSVFYGATEIAKSTLSQKEFTNHQRATMASLGSLACNLFFGVFSILLGIYADKFGPVSALIFANILLLPVILIYIKLFKNKSNLKL